MPLPYALSEFFELFDIWCKIVSLKVRVVQNKEPNHFFRIFQGGMIVSLGGLKNEDEGKEGPNGEKLYHVKATDEFDTHAVQVFV